MPLLTTDLLRRVAGTSLFSERGRLTRFPLAGFLPDQRSLLSFASACKTFRKAAEAVLYAPPFLNTTKAALMFSESYQAAVSPWGRAKGVGGMLEFRKWTPKEVSSLAELHEA